MTVPLVITVEVSLLLTGPALLAAAALLGALVGSSRPVRSVAVLLTYAAVELATLCRLMSTVDDIDALVERVLRTSYAALRTILDVRVELEDGSLTPEQVRTGNPLVVLSRHCGPGDTLYVAWLLVVHYRLRLRVVLKSLLRLEPALDLAADRLPLCFVRKHGARNRERIRELAASLRAGDALLLFPEGGNFSRLRWSRAVLGLIAAGRYLAALRARRRTHTLPPRRGGAAAALTGAPEADVMVLAHSGFTADGRDRPWWRLPVHRPLVVRTTLVQAAGVPRDPEDLTRWLEETWAQVDRWIAEHADESS